MGTRSLCKNLAALTLFLYGGAAQAIDQDVLIVDLYLNEQHMGDAIVLQDVQGNFFVEESVLLEWHITPPWPQPRVFRGKNYYGLNEFAGSSTKFETRKMQLQVTMPSSLMPNRTIDMSRRGIKANSGEFGLYMDYRLNWQDYSSTGKSTTNALMRPVIFGKFGNLSANTIYRRYSGGKTIDEGIVPSGLNVLELTYTLDDPDRLRSLRVGDIFSSPGSQGRSLRMGGIQLATNFETQPSFITYPLPSFFGETSVPTALDVYVNGRLKRTENVQPGSYLLEDVPVVNGAGQFQVVARDALGRQQVFVQDSYSSTQLLKVGLSEYSVSIGALRESYGLENFEYGDFAASGTWNYGLRENLTVGGHGEITNDTGMISGDVKFMLPAGGTVVTGLGLSSGKSGTGTGWKVGFRQQSSFLNYSFDVSGTTREFELIGDQESAPKLQVFGSAGKNLYEFGSVNLSLVHQSYHDRPRRTVASANYSRSIRNVLKLSTYLTYVDAVSNDFSVGIRFSMPFGKRHYAHGGYSSSRGRNSLDGEIIRALPLGNGYGYRVAVGSLDNSYIDAGLTIQSEIGNYTLDVRNSENGGSVWQAGTSGSIAYLSGMTKFTRQIRNSFAVVNVGAIEGVRVYAENIEIGRTDENGQIFVPGLRPYLKNQLRIEIEDLPMNARIGESSLAAAPYDNSGIVVNFDIRVATNVILRAVLPNGSPVPEGSTASVFPSSDNFPVGKDGKLYVQGIDRSSEIEIRWGESVCDIDIPYPTESAIIAKMGDVVCEPRKAQ
jgi:outer membrane usher protein